MGIEGQKITILRFTQLMSFILWGIACYTNYADWGKSPALITLFSSMLYAFPILTSVFKFWILNSRYEEVEYIKRYKHQSREKIDEQFIKSKFSKLKKVIKIFSFLFQVSVFLSLVSIILIYLAADNKLPKFLSVSLVKNLVLINYFVLLFLSLYEKGCSVDSKRILLNS